jgi:phosphopantothenoylcysteine decarboxylase/phosphopantothenate--cysteine ligase
VPLPGNALRVQTTEEMAKAVLKALPEVKILVMCAAVADYQPSTTAKKKYHQDQITLRLKSTTDILAQAAAQPNRPLLVGFSQDDSLARAKAKLRSKHLDLIVANPVKTASAQKVRATLVFASGRIRRLPEISKRDFALELVKTVAGIYQQKGDK